MNTIEVPQMPSFFQLHPEAQEHFQQLAEPTGAAKVYWDDVYSRYTALPKTDKLQKAQILVAAIQDVQTKFPPDEAGVIIRRMYRHLGSVLERYATFDMGEDSNRAEVFLAAADNYIQADGVFGLWSEWANRAVNCLTAAGEVEAAQQLFEQLYGGKNHLVPADGSPESLEALALMKRGNLVVGQDGNRVYDVTFPFSLLS